MDVRDRKDVGSGRLVGSRSSQGVESLHEPRAEVNLLPYKNSRPDVDLI